MFQPLDFGLVLNDASSEATRSQHVFSINQTPQAGTAVSMLEDALNNTQALPNCSTDMQAGAFSVIERNYAPLDNFEAELASYLQSNIHFGISDNWNSGSGNF
jgi:hypothetical protein